MMASILSTMLYWSGIEVLWRFMTGSQLSILMVHGVMDEKVPNHWVPLRPQMSRRSFEKAIKILAKYYRFVSMDEAADMLAGRKPPLRGSLVVTFDDGYRNQIKHALPILTRYKVPATVFLATGHIDKRKPFWFDRLDYALQDAALAGRRINVGGQVTSFPTRNRDEIRRFYHRLRNAAKRVRRDDREFIGEMERIAAELENENGRGIQDIFESDDWSSVLTWDEVREAEKKGVTFGSHTVDHVRLGLVKEGIVRDQLLQSKKRIEEEVGKPCRILCYPSGSYNAKCAEIAREVGYEAAVTTLPGLNGVGTDLMSLRRISLGHQMSKRMLLQQVSGCFVSLLSIKERVYGKTSKTSFASELGD